MARKKNEKQDEVYEILKKRIIKLDYLPNQTLSANELSQEFELNRPALKEVLMRLSSDSLVEVNATNYTVSNFSLQDIIELYQVREALECKSVELILKNGGLSDEQIRTIESLNNELMECVESKRYQDAFGLDDEFHLTMITFSGNKALISLFKHIRIQITRGRWMTLFHSDHNDTWKEHLPIIEALKAKNTVEAREALISHIGRAVSDIEDIFKNADYERALFVLQHMKEAEK